MCIHHELVPRELPENLEYSHSTIHIQQLSILKSIQKDIWNHVSIKGSLCSKAQRRFRAGIDLDPASSAMLLEAMASHEWLATLIPGHGKYGKMQLIPGHVGISPAVWPSHCPWNLPWCLGLKGLKLSLSKIVYKTPFKIAWSTSSLPEVGDTGFSPLLNDAEESWKHQKSTEIQSGKRFSDINPS